MTGTIYGPFSLALDIVAHELTHGVTSSTSKLVLKGRLGQMRFGGTVVGPWRLYIRSSIMYQALCSHFFVSRFISADEPGALNEAMSDIFGACVDRSNGASITDTWRMGEKTFTPALAGNALRYVCGGSMLGCMCRAILSDRRLTK